MAKLSQRIHSTTQTDEYSALLLRQGATTEEDEFVEVHIWGPLTVRTIEQVILTDPKSVPRATIRTIRKKLEEAKVKIG